MKTATAMVLEQFGEPLVRRELPVPELAPGAVLLRLRASGICGSDLDIVSGEDPRVPLPLVPGHEGIGEIAALAGERTDLTGERLQVGDLVAFNRGLTCGRCTYCTDRAQPELCPERQTYGISGQSGCYAEAIVLQPQTELVKLPPGADAVGLVAATCSGATAAHAVELAGLRPGDTVAIIGPGPLGLYAAALSLEQGAGHVVMIGRRRDARLELAAQMGCEAICSAERAPEAGRAAVVLDCAGTAESIGQSLELAAPGATVALPGLATPLPGFCFDPYLLARRQLRLQGVWTSNARHLQQALVVAVSGQYPLDQLVSHVLPLEQANEGLGLLRAKQAIKVVLRP